MEFYFNIAKKDLYKVCNNLKYAIIGGERCDINVAETFYKKTGIMPMTGFGASEVNTTFSLTHPNCSKIGSSGIPLPFNNVKIVMILSMMLLIINPANCLSPDRV